MAKKISRNKGVDFKKITGAAAIGAAVGVAIGMLLAPKKGKALRKDLKDLPLKIKKEVAEKAGEVKDLTQKHYEKLIDAVAGFYKKAKKIKKADLEKVVKELKKSWKEVTKKK